MLAEWIFQIYIFDGVPGQMCYINPESSFEHELVADLKQAACQGTFLVIHSACTDIDWYSKN